MGAAAAPPKSSTTAKRGVRIVPRVVARRTASLSQKRRHAGVFVAKRGFAKLFLQQRPSMLALLGVASPGAHGSGGTSAEHGR
eukprot:scaffold23835_cov60-Phaeocystis_antarctica.AAC.8